MIEMGGLTKRFGELVAVDSVTLTVRPGEVLALLGPNGAGKTTTVRMLSSVLRPTSGWARVAGYDVVTQGQDVRRCVGVLTEAPGLYTRMTGREYLDFFGDLRGLSKATRGRAVQGGGHAGPSSERILQGDEPEDCVGTHTAPRPGRLAPR